jgi:hypothetical protein
LANLLLDAGADPSGEHDSARAVIAVDELDDAIAGRVIGWRKDAMTETITRGIDRGELCPDVRIDVARELGQAFL